MNGKPLYINHNAQVIRKRSLFSRNHFPTGENSLGHDSRPSLLQIERFDTSRIDARRIQRQNSLVWLLIAAVVGAPGIGNIAWIGPTPRRGV